MHEKKFEVPQFNLIDDIPRTRSWDGKIYRTRCILHWELFKFILIPGYFKDPRLGNAWAQAVCHMGYRPNSFLLMSFPNAHSGMVKCVDKNVFYMRSGRHIFQFISNRRYSKQPRGRRGGRGFGAGSEGWGWGFRCSWRQKNMILLLFTTLAPPCPKTRKVM